jgi:hypothetical protein
MFATKVLSSRACELASVDELNLDLIERDPDFVALCKEFISNLRKVEDIIPFKRCWTPSGYTLLGFITSMDGGRPGLGSTIHAIAEKNHVKENDKGESTPSIEKSADTMGEAASESKTESSNLFFSLD